MPSIKTVEQARASHAYHCIQGVLGKTGNLNLDKAEQKKYGQQAKKLPVRIITSGLGQSLAFLQGKGYAQQLQKDIHDWLKIQIKPASPPNDSAPAGNDLLERIIAGDADFLRRATAEALAWLQWLIRFADANDLTEDDTDSGS